MNKDSSISREVWIQNIYIFQWNIELSLDWYLKRKHGGISSITSKKIKIKIKTFKQNQRKYIISYMNLSALDYLMPSSKDT